MSNVRLTKQMQRYAKGQIEPGAYANMSEVVRAGLRLIYVLRRLLVAKRRQKKLNFEEILNQDCFPA